MLLKWWDVGHHGTSLRIIKYTMLQNISLRTIQLKILTQEGVSECETFEEFDALFRTHVAIYMMGAPQFQEKTGCLPPCQYDHYEVELRAVQSVTFSNILKHTSGTGIMISLMNTNKKIVSFHRQHCGLKLKSCCCCCCSSSCCCCDTLQKVVNK